MDFSYLGRQTAPRVRTDAFLPLKNGAVQLSGDVAEAMRFVTEDQLLRRGLWETFVRQFCGDTDDADLGWRCEYWGKMMRGACFTCANTGNAALYRELERTVRELLATEREDGRISTYSSQAQYQGWDLWGRKYVLLGLLYFYDLCRDAALRENILSALRRQADIILRDIGDKPGQKDVTETSSFWGGLNSSTLLEPFVKLYFLTGEPAYRAFADYLVRRGGCKDGNLITLALEDEKAPYEYPVTKAYEMMSYFDGLLEYYRMTGEGQYRRAVENFARKVMQTDITLIGCAGCTHELFDHSAIRQTEPYAGGIMQETCVAVTWMKLCYSLLCLTGDSVYADQMERSMYNTVLGALNTRRCFTFWSFTFDSYSPLFQGRRGRQAGGYKLMDDGRTAYGCCACIGSAGPALYPMSAVLCKQDGTVVLNFYERGEATLPTPAGVPCRLEITGDFAVQGKVRLTFRTPSPVPLSLLLRLPAYSGTVTLVWGGHTITEKGGAYYPLSGTFADGDTVELTLDVPPRLHRLNGRVAVTRGVFVLARDEKSGQDITAFVHFREQDGALQERPAKAGFDTRLCVALDAAEGPVTLVDYPSAGKNWDENQCGVTVFMPEER